MENALNYEMSSTTVAAVLALVALAFVVPKVKKWIDAKNPKGRMKLLAGICFVTGFLSVGAGAGESFARKADVAWMPVQLQVMAIAGGIAAAIVGVVLFIRHADTYEWDKDE